jgi:hypothetical protein
MREAARLTMLTRLGFAARAVLYLVIAMLVITGGRAEDPAGALRYVGQGGGRILLLMMMLGLVAYGIWRLLDAAFNIERHAGDGPGTAERLGAAGSGLIHLFLGWQAFRLSRGAEAAAATDAQDSARSLLTLPGGALLLAVGGLILVCAGGFQLVKAWKASFLDTLEPGIANKAWVQWTGRAGYAARGLVFLLIGAFVAAAGLDERASEAGGMAEALAWLSDPWDKVVAAGLFAFGLFSLVEARFRVLHDVPVRSLGGRLRQKLSL